MKQIKGSALTRSVTQALRNQRNPGYTHENSKYMSHNRSSPAWKEGKSYAEKLAKGYPTGSKPNPLTNSQRKRLQGQTSASNAGGASVGGAS